MTDPFGDLEQHVEEIVTPNKKEKLAVGDKTEAVGTIKGGGGFDAPWLVIHAADVDDLRDQLVNNSAVVEEVLKNLWAASKKFQALNDGPTPAAARRPSAGSTAPAGAVEAPNGESRTCVHGAMVFKSGVAAKTGKPYRLFSCPERDRATQCPAQFLN
jgi:hypothetical protein